MRPRRLAFLLLGMLAFVLFDPSQGRADESEWELVRQTSDGITVKMRQTPGSRVRSAFATMMVDAPPLRVLEVACESETYKSTEKYVKKLLTYPSKSPDIWHVYYLVKFPVVSSRDYTLRYERDIDSNANTYRLSWRIAEDVGPRPSDRIVRVEKADGWITITPHNRGRQSKLKYFVHADPGGNIPAWVINLANRVSIPEILRDIRDEAENATRPTNGGSTH